MPTFCIQGVRTLLAIATCVSAVAHAAATPWPAETWSSAVNLTSVEGAGTNDLHQDLSGLFWNPVTRRLWVCRNGPTNSTSKVWRLKESVAGGWEVEGGAGAARCEWTGFNDAEAITQADLVSNTVYVMAEGEDVIRMYNLATPGMVVQVRTYDVHAHLPTDGGDGAEGLTFVPDGHLAAGGFVNGAGVPTQSQKGMGGLFFVGHQNGGRVYVFDLSATDSTLTFVGSYLTNASETADLCFDRSTGRLLVLHGNNINTIEVCSLASTASGGERRLATIETMDRPTGSASNANIEGLAVFANGDATGGMAGRRSLFLTIDDGGATSLLWFRQFPNVCRGDWNGAAGTSVDDLFLYLNAWFTGDPRADVDFSGAVAIDDLFLYLNAWFTGCA